MILYNLRHNIYKKLGISLFTYKEQKNRDLLLKMINEAIERKMEKLNE